jgi:hypothetical protein
VSPPEQVLLGSGVRGLRACLHLPAEPSTCHMAALGPERSFAAGLYALDLRSAGPGVWSTLGTSR